MYTVSGKADKNDLLESHVPLVKKLAHQMKAKLPPSVEVDDLIQAGLIGLLDAVSRYEETHGAQFETYAVQRIRGAMLDELRNSDWLPRTVRQNMRKIETAMNKVQQRLGRPPREAEIANELKLSLEEYQSMLHEGSGHQLVYYEDFHDRDESDHFLDRFIMDESSDPLQALTNAGFRKAVIQAIEALPEREKILMGLYYEQEMNLKEIGAVMGVSESRVCQLHSQAIARMRARLRGAGMDWASLIGLALGLFGILVGQALEGGHFASLVQPAAFVIVVVGTFGAVLLQSGMDSFIKGMRMLVWVVQPPRSRDGMLANQVTAWSSTARREGLLSLERYLDSISDPFVRKGIGLIVDGIDPYKIRTILEADISTYERRERQASKIWEAAGGYAPTIGILGAVLGLIHVMENLSDPSMLGGGIAVAFVATIYGVGFANLVFLPIANKLKSIIGEEVCRREMLTDVFCSIANGDNARVLEELLQAYR